ncbi:MAG: TaqI-like C-terminal specificity domain-containing protein [Moraxella sp.]|nr:TaqI-like C-terminal specificity domain-containing protein [Moraxella sp.]
MFQSLIINQFISRLDQHQLLTAYADFTAHFHNDEIQANIRQAKEEQYQEGFLKDLFVKILGYTINPQPNYNLTTELKNIKGAKKCDGAILQDGHAIAVIELKGMDTTDLDRIETQAFGYKNNHPHCRYVITSNFQKLRFYMDNSVQHLEFNLFKLSFDEFSLLYLLLHRNHLLTNLPVQLKQSSISQEEKVTKQLYKDYSAFKSALFEDLVRHNEQYDQLTLFNKTQKLLDRLLFIFFAEDGGLLPANTAHKMIKEWEQARQLNIPISIYGHLKNYFGYLNTGHKTDTVEIFAYNGGLFKPDEILDHLSIPDDVLYTHIKKLADYDFNSEIDVNILGHIFENSLNEIDEIKAKINGKSFDKSQSKRKKDGVFYTPKYITSYIITNTVGKLCNDKKTELGIIDTEYTPNRSTKIQEKLYHNLTSYRDWLLSITICDPACGSGAFLNEALNFLIAEHRYIDELEGKLTGSSLQYQNISNHILENNLFGVDINDESVQIAKLSLWLRTAEPYRKLSNLNENIKCGNSLIDDPAVAGDKAFDWHAQFPAVFEKGGFDVVIGNPPYVRAELLPNKHINFYKEKYQVFSGTGDLFSYFYEKSFAILKDTGLFGFISNTFDKTAAGATLRDYLQNTKKFIKYVDFTEVQIFEGATTYPIILIASKNHQDDNEFEYIKIPKSMQGNVSIDDAKVVKVSQNTLDKNTWSFNNNILVGIMEKIKKFPTVRESFGKCYYGIKTGLNEAFIIDKATCDMLIAKDKNSADIIEPIYEGKDLNKWINPLIEKYILGLYPAKKLDIENYPAIKEYLVNFGYERLQQIGGAGHRKKTSNKWFETQDSIGYYPLLKQPKIVWSNLCNSNKFSFDENGYSINAPACLLPTDNKGLLAVLNSKIVWLFLTNICVVRNGGYIEVKPQYFEQIPIPNNSESLTEKAEQMLALNAELQSVLAKFLRTLERKFELSDFSKNLQSWHTLDYKAFIKELAKKKIKLSLSDEAEWEDYFIDQQQKAAALASQIDRTDHEINQLVYELYGLTDEEIEVVENGS